MFWKRTKVYKSFTGSRTHLTKNINYFVQMCSQHGRNFVDFVRSYLCQQHPQNWTHLNKMFWCCEHSWTKSLGVVNTVEQNLSVLWTQLNKIPRCCKTIEHIFSVLWRQSSDTIRCLESLQYIMRCDQLIVVHYPGLFFQSTWKPGLRNTIVRLVQ